MVIPNVCLVVWAGRSSLKESVGHMPLPGVCFPDPETGSQQFSGNSRGLCSLGCSYALPTLPLIHTQAFEIRPVNRGLGCDSQPAQGRSKVWAPGQGRPSPSVPGECGQQDPRSGGDESPPAPARAELIVYVRALLLGGFCHPTLPLLLSLPSSSPWVAPVATLRAQTGSPAQDATGESLPFVPSGSSPSHSAERLSVKGGRLAGKGLIASLGPTEAEEGASEFVAGVLFCDPRTDNLPVRSLK